MTSTNGLATAAEHAGGVPRRVLPEARVHAGRHPVEAGQQLVLEVEPAVGEDVHLGGLEHDDVVLARVLGVDLLPLAAHPLGVEAARHRQALGVVADRQVGVAARAGRLDHLGDRARAVAPAGVRVQVAPGGRRAPPAPAAGPRAAASISPRSSRSSGGIEVEAEGGVDALLVGVGGAPAVRSEDAVLRDRQALAHRELAQADVVGRRAGRVLEEVAERLGGTHGELEAHAGVGRHRGARVAARQLPRSDGRVRERVLQVRGALASPRPGRCRARSRDRAAGSRRPRPARRGRRRGGRGRSPRPRAARWPMGTRSSAASSAASRASSAARRASVVAPKPGRRVAGPRRAPRPGRRRSPRPSSLPQRRGPLGADAVEPGDRGEAGRDPVAQLREGGDVAGLDQLDDLGLEGRADVRQVHGAARHRHLRDRRGGRADARGGPAVGEDAVAHRALELEQVADQAEPVGDLAIGREAPRPSEESKAPPVNLEGATARAGRLRHRWYRLPAFRGEVGRCRFWARGGGGIVTLVIAARGARGRGGVRRRPARPAAHRRRPHAGPRQRRHRRAAGHRLLRRRRPAAQRPARDARRPRRDRARPRLRGRAHGDAGGQAARRGARGGRELLERQRLRADRGSPDWSFDVDTVAPRLAVAAPKPQALRASKAVKFRGRAEAGSTVTVAYQGGEATAQAGADGAWSAVARLPEGKVATTVTAVDRAGNTTAAAPRRHGRHDGAAPRGLRAGQGRPAHRDRPAAGVRRGHRGQPEGADLHGLGQRRGRRDRARAGTPPPRRRRGCLRGGRGRRADGPRARRTALRHGDRDAAAGPEPDPGEGEGPGRQRRARGARGAREQHRGVRLGRDRRARPGRRRHPPAAAPARGRGVPEEGQALGRRRQEDREGDRALPEALQAREDRHRGRADAPARWSGASWSTSPSSASA